MASQGKRAGSRRAAARPRQAQPRLLALAASVTVAIVAWGYLVFAAIDFGASARSGDGTAWWLLVLASLGAVACLFLGLMLVARLLRELGITEAPSAAESPPADPAGSTRPSSRGGRRSLR